MGGLRAGGTKPKQTKTNAQEMFKRKVLLHRVVTASEQQDAMNSMTKNSTAAFCDIRRVGRHHQPLNCQFRLQRGTERARDPQRPRSQMTAHSCGLPAPDRSMQRAAELGVACETVPGQGEQGSRNSPGRQGLAGWAPKSPASRPTTLAVREIATEPPRDQAQGWSKNSDPPASGRSCQRPSPGASALSGVRQQLASGRGRDTGK